jgi:hypothetical protein
MPSTYSPDLRIELIANGEQSGTWGTTTNNNLGTLIEDAISGRASVAVTSANQALTASNGATDQARCAAIDLSIGTWPSPSNFNVYVPPVTKLYVVRNTDSTYTATVYCSTVIGNTTAAGTGVAIPAGKAVLIRSDGTNVFEQFNHVVGGFSVGGALAVTGASTLTGAATFGSTVTLNANPVLNLQAATKQYVDTAVSNSIPTGGIIMWSGTIATIPSGWALCNGSNGTPDLRDRFIIGASQDSGGAARTNITGSLTQTGGSKDAIVVSHTHTATVTDPGHSHSYIASVVGTPQTGLTGDLYTAPNRTTSTATTGITVSNSTTGSSGTDANLVPYYALAFIMKT